MRTEYAMSVLYASVAGFCMEVFKTLPNTEENSTLLTKVLSLSVFFFPVAGFFFCEHPLHLPRFVFLYAKCLPISLFSVDTLTLLQRYCGQLVLAFKSSSCCTNSSVSFRRKLTVFWLVTGDCCGGKLSRSW